MYMPTQDEVSAVIIERLPERLSEAVASADAETWLMPVGQDVTGCVCCQICPQPLLLWRTGLAAANAGLSALGIEDDDVPGADRKSVVKGKKVELGGRRRKS